MAAKTGKGASSRAKAAKQGKPVTAKAAAKTQVKTGKATKLPRARRSAAAAAAERKPDVVALPARLSVAAALLRRNARRVGI